MARFIWTDVWIYDGGNSHCVQYCTGYGKFWYLPVQFPDLLAQRFSLEWTHSFSWLFRFCVMTGYLMDHGLSRRLIDWVECIFGKESGERRSGNKSSCAIFAALVGSGPATIAAIGALMIPALRQSGYREKPPPDLWPQEARWDQSYLRV